MRAGRRNKRVTIEAAQTVDNGRGGRTVTGWTPITPNPTVWAEIVGLSGDEALREGVARSVQQWRVTMRARDDLTTKHRLTHGGKLYNIRSIMPDPREPDAMLLICESGGAKVGG